MAGPCLGRPSWQPGSQALPAYQLPCLLRMGTAPSSPSENKKTCFASGGVERVASLAPGRPPGRAASGRAACCCWMARWLPGRLFPPAVQARPAGEEAPGLRAASRTPCHNKGTMAWTGWRWEGGRAAPFVLPLPPGTGTGCWEVCSPLPSPTPVLFSTLSATVSHRGAKENRGLRKRFGAVAGDPQPGRQQSRGRGLASHRLLSAWGCS